MGQRLLKVFECACFFVAAASCAYWIAVLGLSTNAKERLAGVLLMAMATVFFGAALLDYAAARIPESWKAGSGRVRQAVKEMAKLTWERTSRAREIGVPVSYFLVVILLRVEEYRTGRLTQGQIATLALILLAGLLFLVIGTLAIKICFWVGGLWERHQEHQREYWYWFRHSPTLPLPRGRG